jgi:protein-arginine kinase activator protein McsA
MTQKYTPGPWQYNDAGLIYGQINGEQNEALFVCNVCNKPGSDKYSKQEKANARLIATAPELLALLQELNAAFYVNGTRKALMQVIAKTKPLIRRATMAQLG